VISSYSPPLYCTSLGPRLFSSFFGKPYPPSFFFCGSRRPLLLHLSRGTPLILQLLFRGPPFSPVKFFSESLFPLQSLSESEGVSKSQFKQPLRMCTSNVPNFSTEWIPFFPSTRATVDSLKFSLLPKVRRGDQFVPSVRPYFKNDILSSD